MRSGNKNVPILASVYQLMRVTWTGAAAPPFLLNLAMERCVSGAVIKRREIFAVAYLRFLVGIKFLLQPPLYTH